MKKAFLALFALATSFLCSTQAQVVLNFDGLSNGDYVDEAYNGGTSSTGVSLTNHGVSFTDALVFQAAGNYPSVTNMAITTDTADTIVMNVTGGFTQALSFIYGSLWSETSFAVYDGLNASGSLLFSAELPVTGLNIITPYYTDFNGTAYSVVFNAGLGQLALENITLGAVTPVPEPSTYGLMAAGALAGLGFLRRRRSQKQAA